MKMEHEPMYYVGNYQIVKILDVTPATIHVVDQDVIAERMLVDIVYERMALDTDNPGPSYDS